MIYLAGPIDVLHKDHPGENWRDDAATMLRKHGIGAFTPVGAYLYMRGSGRDIGLDICKMNRRVIRESSGVLATLDTGLAFGTIREIEYATCHGVTVWMVTRRDLTSVIESFDLLVYPSLREATDAIAEARTSRTG